MNDFEAEMAAIFTELANDETDETDDYESGTFGWFDQRADLETRFGPPPWKLNIGCGFNHIEDLINIDSEPKAQPDLLWNAEEPWPFPSNCVDYVAARHVVEHLHDLKTFFQEAYRVMLPDSVMEIVVPHHCSDSFWGDPTHVRPITRMMLDLLSKRNCEFFNEKGYSNTPLATYWEVDFEPFEQTLMLHDRWENKFADMDACMLAISQFNNVCNEIKFLLRRIKEQE